jgi:hypothetical protein
MVKPEKRAASMSEYFHHVQKMANKMAKILGYEIIPSNPLKYARSKQGLNVLWKQRNGLKESR